MTAEPLVKPIRWIASSRSDLRSFPEPVRLRMGGALWEAQRGGKAPWAKPLKGFGGSGVVEIVDDYDGDAYRAVYAICFADVVYVLHAFQKKSKTGIATPQKDLRLVEARLKRAQKDYEQWRQQGTKTS